MGVLRIVWPVLHPNNDRRASLIKSGIARGFPGSGVVKTSPSSAGGMSLIPGQEAKILPAAWPRNHNIK